MRTHHLSVTSLEEYEHNPEFVGRNFNAGEVIQLVLKARGGRWLPFEYVQMVMMHEYVLLLHPMSLDALSSGLILRPEHANHHTAGSPTASR